MSTEEKDIATQPKHENPFLLPYGTPHNTPPFGRFTLQDVEGDRSSDKAKPDKTNGFHDVLYPFPSHINKNYVLILKEYTINVK